MGKMLDIDQCPDRYHVPNAFKETHKCDDKSSYCVPIQGRGFETGGYKCECKQGYEYPFEDPITYVDGQFTESEFNNMVVGKPTRYDMLKCISFGHTKFYQFFSYIGSNFNVILRHSCYKKVLISTKNSSTIKSCGATLTM